MSETTKQEGDFKVKAKVLKPKQLSKSDKPIKVDLSKPKEEKIIIPVAETKSPEEKTPIAEVEKQPKEITDEKPIIEEIIEEPVEEKKEEEVVEIGEKMETPISKENEFVAPNMDLPENVEKLVEFMRETGGTLEDYVRLNADYSNVDNDTLLREYYKNTKSHLNSEEINFMIEDNFAFDEEVDEERDVRKAKLAYKEEVAKAKQHLETLKSNYYQEIKLRPGTTQEQQKATDFFNRYNEEQGVAKQQHEDFQSQTKDYFTNEFKGFDFKVGEKKFRYGVKNVNDVVDKQLNISNTIKKFLNNTGEVKDVQGYHKAIYAADNADSIAQHFYEQGKSDAVREISAKSNNVSMSEPRSAAPSDIKVGGYTIKSVSGLDSSKLKIKKSF
jgi:dsDNA-binding SOS-regulon protein